MEIIRYQTKITKLVHIHTYVERHFRELKKDLSRTLENRLQFNLHTISLVFIASPMKT